MEDTETSWAVVELMGHRTRAGRISEVEKFGAKMLRIDIPVEGGPGEAGTDDFVTEFYAGSAVYGVTPITEDIFRAQHYKRALPARPLRYSEEVPWLDSPHKGGSYDDPDNEDFE